ncbi:MAG TPA: diguanylate cyclase [Solirubrobacteraceae bacterium]|jgi:diguanylate cyclase (GGDEF)-like protein/putative nucleotidyltransferase with HDIG domain|nr:diguanylate cyclase [Solirubrobacteraceae bacterium]
MFGKASQSAELMVELERLRQRVSELESLRARERQFDTLTGVLSAHGFRGRLADEVTRARRYQRLLSLAVIGIDDFAAIEASHGFAAGDELVSRLAERLVASTLAHDLVGRTAAAEFAVLLPETAPLQAQEDLERLLLDLEGVRAGPVSATGISIGVAGLTADRGGEALVDAARRACADGQHAGGGRVMVADAQPAVDIQSGDPERSDAIEALAATLTERDRYTGEHSAAVIEMSAAVARNLGLRDAEVDWIRSAALLHDIGKVAIPDEILHKPGPLSDTEWSLMKQHPVIGERILRALPGMGVVARIVRHEHERWDGTGYPDRLAGEQIPLGSRIILAADTYHAITSDRPYRAARSHADAIDELSQGSGSQFDPAVTAALIGHLYGRRQAGVVSV